MPTQANKRLSTIFRHRRVRGPVLAGAAAMVACALVGVLLGAYLHEIRAAPLQRFVPIQTTGKPEVRTTVRTQVVTVVKTTTETEPAPQQVAQREALPKPTPTATPTTTPTTTPKKATTTQSSTPPSPAITKTQWCDSLLLCVSHG